MVLAKVSGMVSSNMVPADNVGSAFQNGSGISPAIADLNNVTIANNLGHGFHEIFSSTVNFRNTLLAGNSLGDCSGTLTSQDYNLIQVTTGCALTGTIAHVITGTAPLLGPLQDNGGPTWTHALLLGSPAIDAGNPALPGSGGNACAVTDQRGVARPVGATCDIGAYEGVARFLFLPVILR
jgi:hypothetical protein